jgi:hypothetical protein
MAARHFGFTARSRERTLKLRPFGTGEHEPSGAQQTISLVKKY